MNNILVPTDFSQASAKAAQYAAALSQVYQAAIQLLHVVSTPKQRALKNHGQSIAELEQKLQITATQLSERFNVKTTSVVRRGSVFHAINLAADEWKCPLVILGNHGVTNFYQQLFGPYALRLANASSTNYLMVNESSPEPVFKNIVLPVTYASNQQAKLALALQLAKHYKSTVHLLYQFETDEKKMQQVLDNMNSFRDAINTAGLTLYKMPQPEGISFTDLLINYAEEGEADLIFADVDKAPAGIQYLQEKLVNNSKNIPVLCVPAGM